MINESLNPGISYLISSLLRLPAIVIVLTLHGFVKALLSSGFGNPIPKREGRLTLNPLKHMDALGFIVFCASGYGWGKPVNTNAVYFKDRRRDTLICGIVPALSCLALGVLSAFAAYILIGSGAGGFLVPFLIQLYGVGASFFLINIIPIYPMDGAAILRVFLSPRLVVRYASRERMFQFALLAFIWIGIARMVFEPAAQLLLSAIGSVSGL